ncbi:galanin peptides isoform X2 [Python bivittatus]|uniref:Galanin peptides n=1 Tax=Python bivittatus TaxID=176946 RepID=A0A9F2QUQ7_PYTBI|nr:galanin peptides isoform X2 [Python bivittatus]
MQRHPGLLFVCLIFCAALSETFGLVLSVSNAKEKRGWTMNSAGYLLGPHAINRVFSDKHGLAGKRDIHLEENIKADASTRLLTYNNIIRTIIEFLAYLHLKEAGALDNIATTVSSEERDQS